MSAGNPVLSVPDGHALERALAKLDLFVSLDFYVNETNRHADYVLPSTTLYERDDVPLAFLGFFTQPFIQVTDAVVPPPGRGASGVGDHRRHLASRRGRALQHAGAAAARSPGRAALAAAHRRPPDSHRAERRPASGCGAPGSAWPSFAGLPHGIVLDEQIATGVLRGKLRTEGKRVRLCPPEIARELERIGSVNGSDPDFPLLLIGLRELRSHNSWMHNAPLLMRGGRVHALRIHPADAAALGLEDGARAQVESKSGAVEVPVTVTDEMTPGTVALPHGWGHRGGWRLANEHAGANVNLLTSSDPRGPRAAGGHGAPERHTGRVAPATAGRA